MSERWQKKQTFIQPRWSNRAFPS